MSDDVIDRWIENLRYRGFYSLAHNLVVEHRERANWNQDPTRWILAEVMRQKPTRDGDDPARDRELAREAVEDAVAKRKPRW